ncbi:DNA replication and repair protein RecN [Coprococcus catus GD/7]|uniref:DNA repair protein RecN n=1 Tax=Coprococcus catus GD/7 TaxID=717962 RepID=D4J424_9FIRM|nr:DNA repair protein RecN [Coprococcus catus]CBK79095.1 DNA replication and repair protein RecN [Coprococcus catus GD/7]
MLQNIHVKNMALIDEADVDFGGHLNILTGETGAGKSIIIGSISTALGGKVSRDVIRKDAEYALVELNFKVNSPQILAELEKMEIPVDGDEVVISRRITGSRSVARINGELVSLPVLRQAAALLIDIHGQHEHQSLLHKDKHLAILDQFSREEMASVKDALKDSYREYMILKKEMDGAITDEGKRLSEISFLQYQIEEIENANLQDGEEEQLDKAFRKMSHARQMMESVAAAHGMTGYEGASSAGDLVGRALRELSSVEKYDEAIGGLISMLTDIDGLLNDFNRELADYESGLTFDESVYHETEDRLNLIQRLKTKYGSSIAEILAHQAECQEELEKLDDYENYLSGLRMKLDQAEKELKDLSDKLTTIRRANAAVLQERIKAALIDLNFLDVRFEIHCEPLGHYTENGQDSIEFMISTNPGETVKPLGKVASGGELSRIMLAVKSVLADADAIETLIFDEIDTGISGRTAQKVSEKMAVIARKHQVICITHLPQIAAMADDHYVIEKSAMGQRTITEIYHLSDDASVGEIARLLGGVEITDAVMQNAREMKNLAQSKK